jgi:aerotaxis receptor
MQNNGPISQLEYVLPEDEVIITHTDTTSRITYANPAFMRSSGFSLEEVLGQPQNIVRHPDMPREAFADLWKTIRAGKSWSGLVKNRRKNGGFYWVRANVTPMMDANGRIGSYMSVRVKPSRDEVQQCEKVYADIRAGRGHRLQIVEGRIVDTSLLGTLGRLKNLSLRTGTWLVMGFLTALLVGASVLSFNATGINLLTAMSSLSAMIAFANMLYIQGNVVQPLLKLHHVAFQLVSGNTRSRIPAEGVSCIVAVAKAFEQVRVKLDGVLKDNIIAANEVRDGVGGVVQANTELSHRQSEHASSLQETAASIEQLTATVMRNTDNARQATQLATQSATATSRGREVVAQVHAMMVAITQSSKRIGDIVGIIDGIAFQTNLLALNAAVEAARAGDQGRGFAVVAQEVRSLAQRSASAAREIKELIEASGQTVTRGSELASTAEQSMQQVVESVHSVASVISEIEMASREQSAGIEQINQAVTQMDRITQRDAQMSEELIETAGNLQRQSEQMLAAISAFSMQGGSNHRVTAAPAESASNPHRSAEDRYPELRRVA